MLPEFIPIIFQADGHTYKGIFERVRWTAVEFKYDLLVGRFHQGEMRIDQQGNWKWGSNYRRWEHLTVFFALWIEMTVECS